MDAKERQQNDNVEREALKLEIDSIPFNGIASTKYVTSNDLCKNATEVFKEVFADCEGSTFDIIGNFPALAILFNHGVYDEGACVACSREVSVNANSSIMEKYRMRDYLLTNGDKYFLTEDGKDVFRNLISFQAFNNGKPNWGKVVAEFSESTQQRFYGMQAPQYTKVGYIDLNKFAALVWGDKDEEGNAVEYQVSIVRPLNSGVPGMPPSNYMLSVTQVSAKELQATYEKLGFGSFSSIVR